ncbi:L,D-transpeptidase [Methylobacterium nodulans]|uniref:ErfK/YbiS/YcfS/YnhG family protein n=1 Tax=Methylobacterium nodulans (strain LMG 21967 / CNCM I-2342 / ORS 2060) TaxID=460265 RepID=B8IQ39_METNO|nr:L,D-transpeptidase [Methylobacterium nodulans]ACL58539.1 ErfK/YbiS/YcfS/YnhG family protein [Methylobacterium nodulans ORS 2060]
MSLARAAAFAALLLTTAASLPSRADVLIAIDKTNQRMTVSVDGRQRYVWPVSTGMAGYETPSGSFRPFRMERDHFSKEWDDAPMPYSVFFTPVGHAIHGTSHVRQIGRPASHGCVRLRVRNAATLFSLVRAEGLSNTRVVVRGEEMVVARRGGRRSTTAMRPDRFDVDEEMPTGSLPVYGDDGGSIRRRGPAAVVQEPRAVIVDDRWYDDE